MHDRLQIVAAFESLCSAGEPAALATVVAVEGSTYRRPGARMLVTGDGRTWGTISGGCLERDVARRARMLIPEVHSSVVVCYETDDNEGAEEDARPNPDPGPSLGCGGRIEILIQRVTGNKPGPMAAMTAVVRQRAYAAIATVIRTGSTDDRDVAAGMGIYQVGNEEPVGSLSDQKLYNAMVQQIAGNAEPGRKFQLDRHTLSHGGWAEVLTEWLAPSQALVIFGDGHDVVPLVEMAGVLGWHVTVIGSRSPTALSGDFSGADQLICSGERIARNIPADAAVVVMGHNFRRDAAILGELLHRPRKYIGILGPRRRTARLLAAAGCNERDENIFSPIGLDIGADNPEQIALAIVAEIQAVFSDGSGKSLRQRPGPIHLHRDKTSADCHCPR